MLILKQLLQFRIEISLKPGQSERPFYPDIHWAVLDASVHNLESLGIQTSNIILS